MKTQTNITLLTMIKALLAAPIILFAGLANAETGTTDTPWRMILGTIVVSIAVVWLAFRIFRFQSQKRKRYLARLEKIVKQRTKELEEANEQLLNASVTDQLTGMKNRRFLHDSIQQECALIQRDIRKRMSGNEEMNPMPRLFCLMFDLDGFKPINDTYGHDAGDKIICQVGNLLSRLCRNSDTVVRWGGDEFLITGRIEDMNEVKILAERIRQEIVTMAFDIGISQKLHLSCSIGYALYPFSVSYPDFINWDQVQVIADRALYHAKGKGKNAWAGIVSTEKQPSMSFMNTLITSLEQVVEQGYVQISEPSAPYRLKVGNTPSEIRTRKAS